MTSRLPEQALWDRMRKGVLRNAEYREVLLQRVEAILPGGFPDVLAQRMGRVTPIELKVAQSFRGKGRALRKGSFSTEQRNWHLEWRQHGGASMVVVQTDEDEYAAITGPNIDLINESTTIQELKALSFLFCEGDQFWDFLRARL